MGIKQQTLISPIQRVGLSLGCQMTSEMPVESRDGKRGLIDLFVTKPGSRHRVAIEAELQGRRIEGDVRKSEAARATECWILVPNRHVARAANKRVQRVVVTPYTPAIYVFTLPQAIEMVVSHFKSHR